MIFCFFFFFNETATTEIYTLSLHDALPIWQADTILFNTCSVRQHAEDKIYSALGRLKHAKRDNPRKIIGLAGYGLEVVERVPIVCPASAHSERYLKTKKEKLGHLL